MFLQDHIKVGTRVERADNPRHTGVVYAMMNVAPGLPHLTAGVEYRVRWDNGWKEEGLERGDLNRESTED